MVVVSINLINIWILTNHTSINLRKRENRRREKYVIKEFRDI